ncbi:vWA domain-containing protein [Streptomyces carminius]|uniref:vWA domain-containing protein n=1 Tax=Streptomyces carminius TaxID=2665496 RepID=UPI001E2C97BE|nr:vWA domain-containing protein [Streptomyces carminius]
MKHNLAELREALTDERTGVFRKDRVETVPATSCDTFLRALRRATEKTTGLLLVYYSGHAWLSTDGHELFLTAGNSDAGTDPGGRYLNAVSWQRDVCPLLRTRRTWTGLPGRRRRAKHIVVVLDCCYAGNALSGFDPGGASVSVLTAVQSRRMIPSGSGDECTPYTRKLVELLRNRDRDEPVTVAWLAGALFAAFQGVTTFSSGTTVGDRWCPQSRLSRDAHHVVLARGEEPQRGPSLRERAKERARVLARWCGRNVRRPAAVVPAAVALALAAVALVGFLRPLGGSADCPSPLELRLLADADARPAVQKVVDGFLDSGGNKDDDGCRSSGVTVYEAKSTDAVEFLRDGSTGGVAAQPDIWIPGATSTYRRAAAGGTGEAALELLGPVAYSPVVVAVPDVLSLSQAQRNAHPLAHILESLRKSNPHQTVLRADPEHTDAAQLATVTLYGEHPSTKPIADDELFDYEQDMAAELSPVPETSHALMCRLASDAGLESRAQVLIPEHVMVRFGLLSDDLGRPGCATATLGSHTALYPTDVPMLDHPFVHVTWRKADRDTGRREAAVRRLHEWFTGDRAQRILIADGYRGVGEDNRPAAPRGGSPVAESQTVPKPVLSAQEVTGEAVTRTLGQYREALGSGRVLYLLDSSSSMAGVWEGRGMAKHLLSQSLESLGRRDEYGIWSVASAARTRDIAAFGRHDREAARDALAKARTLERDADIGRALDDALELLAAPPEGDRPRLVVLITDGEDSADITGDERAALLERVGRERIPVVVVALQISGCADGGINRRIADRSRGRCLDFSGDRLRELRDEVARVGTGDAR